jgi:hypothetical protein
MREVRALNGPKLQLGRNWTGLLAGGDHLL